MPPVSLFLLLWLRLARYRWSRFRRLFERGDLGKSIDPAASLQEIEDLLKQVTWTMDAALGILADEPRLPQSLAPLIDGSR